MVHQQNNVSGWHHKKNIQNSQNIPIKPFRFHIRYSRACIISVPAPPPPMILQNQFCYEGFMIPFNIRYVSGCASMDGQAGHFSKMAAAENRVFWVSGRFYFILTNKRPGMLHFVICYVVVIYQLVGKNIKWYFKGFLYA